MSRHQFAIMFADVSGSSRLYKVVGNVQARALVSEAVVRMLRAVRRYEGVLVKTIGDEVMARFPTAEQAIHAAIDMQREAETPIDGQILPLRIGVNFGATILENDDVFGEAVNDAAALVKIARARQIVTNADTIQCLPPVLRSLCTVFDRVILKGGQHEEEISRVAWEPAEGSGPSKATVVMTAINLHPVTPEAVDALELHYLGRQLVVTPATTPFHIGRDRHKCQLVIDSTSASRDHCQIEFRRGKYVLVDHSTNGTCVQMTGNKNLFLRREELPLTGEGEISIGQPVGTVPELTILFRL